jgi:probable HAF family extracellular repeat protein
MLQALGIPEAVGLDGQAFAINASGRIVGWAQYPSDLQRASLWYNGSITDLGALGGEQESMAFGINDAGEVTGESNYDGGNYLSYHAFLYRNAAMTDLGLLPGYEYGSVGAAINADGLVVGSSYATYYEHVHGFLFDGTTLNDLGALPGDDDSQALGINSSGQVVGWSGSVYPKIHRAFLYQDGVMIDLNSQIRPRAGWTLTDATAINDAGQIVGFGTNPDGQIHAFLLTPTDFGAAPLQVRMDPLTAQALTSHVPIGAANEESSPVALRAANGPSAATAVDGDVAARPVVIFPAAGRQHSAYLVLAVPGESGLGWMPREANDPLGGTLYQSLPLRGWLNP